MTLKETRILQTLILKSRISTLEESFISFLGSILRRHQILQKSKQVLALKLLPIGYASLILDDDNDDRVTVVNQDAGKVHRKENPPSFQPPQPSDQHGDVSIDPPSNFYPFNSELNWRVAQWAVQDNPGQNALDRLLSIPGVCLFLSDLFMQMLMLYP